MKTKRKLVSEAPATLGLRISLKPGGKRSFRPRISCSSTHVPFTPANRRITDTHLNFPNRSEVVLSTVHLFLPFSHDDEQGKSQDYESISYGACAEHLTPIQRHAVDEPFVGRGSFADCLLLTRVSIRCDGENWDATGSEPLRAYLEAVSRVL